MNAALHGIIAEFLEPAEVLAATRMAYARGYRRMDAYTPYVVEELAEALGQKTTGVPLVTLLCGLTGGLAGFFMQYYSATVSYPLNVGGRPLDSWPMFVPITFELTILFGALGTALAMFAMNGLPCLHHPVFDTPFFETHSHSRFYLCIEAGDPGFSPEAVREFLAQQHPSAIWEVPA